jgi:hypothetical protein
MWARRDQRPRSPMSVFRGSVRSIQASRSKPSPSWCGGQRGSRACKQPDRERAAAAPAQRRGRRGEPIPAHHRPRVGRTAIPLALVRRASAWADRHEIPVYSHVRGLWLWARALRHRRAAQPLPLSGAPVAELAHHAPDPGAFGRRPAGGVSGMRRVFARRPPAAAVQAAAQGAPPGGFECSSA